jgi:hypothetical protein
MDSPWAHKRRSRLRFGMLLVLSIFLGGYFLYNLWTPPSCFDGKLNQGELGVDCGGPCDLFCPFQVSQLHTVWARGFKISDGRYAVVAYIENPNHDKYTENAHYRVRLIDAAGETVAEQAGTTFFGGEPRIPLYIGPIETGDGIPATVVFEWDDSRGQAKWYKKRWEHELAIEGYREVDGVQFGSEIRATLVNRSPEPAYDVDVVVVVYDDNENALTASRTFVENLGARERKQVSFAWPRAFPQRPQRIEVVARTPMPAHLSTQAR